MPARAKSQSGKPQGGNPQGDNSQLGIALVEALVAILIFSFGVLGLIALESKAVNFSVSSEDRNRAALFASEVASAMWTAGSVDYINNAQLAAQYAVWQANIGNPTTTGLTNGTLAIVPATVPGTTKAVDIKITWRPPADIATAHTSAQTTSIGSTLTTRVILP